MNIHTMEKFLEDEKVNSIGEKTILQHFSILKSINNFKPLSETWIKQDVNNYILSLSDKYKKSSIEKHKQILKKFFTWAGNENAVNHLKIKTINNELNRDEILTREDINKLIETTESTLHKALIAFLFESGARVGEALALKVKDIQETDKGMMINLPSTKTGNGGINYRRNVYTFSAQYIRNHITYAALKKEDQLFKISQAGTHSYYSKLAKRAGINKPVSAHKFRHARATDLVITGWNDSLIKQKLGWKPTSHMIARYTHIGNEDVINETLEKAGIIPQNKIIVNINQAESLKLIDASLQLQKLSEENIELNKNYIKTKEESKALESRLNSLEEIIRKLVPGTDELDHEINLHERLLEIENDENQEEGNKREYYKEFKKQEEEIELAIKLGKTPPERKITGYIENIEEGNYIYISKEGKKEIVTRDEYIKRSEKKDIK
jgi:integrase